MKLQSLDLRKEQEILSMETWKFFLSPQFEIIVLNLLSPNKIYYCFCLQPKWSWEYLLFEQFERLAIMPCLVATVGLIISPRSIRFG